ncbi:SdpI family protein [Hydrogenoanaerobacterium sp.]|uniref:SdpI family protein n=1 Tax=Hydrogenoanaerobacterium sp. TaxID=2953763 RepID=UPI00289875CE|nr:SdpI family protein [Hydrogenoanaerobacterium sp.]
MKYQKITVPIAIVNLIALVTVTTGLPEQVPVHINIHNIVDGYGPRWVVPLFGLIPLLMLGGMFFYHRYTENNSKVQKNKKTEEIVFTTLALFFTVFSWFPVLVASQTVQQVQLPMELIVGLPLGALMIVLGNYMGVIKQNRFFGIRTKWTLGNEEVWRKTHRKAAYWSVAAGLIIIASSLLAYAVHDTMFAVVGLILSIVLLAVVPIVYSYIVYKKLKSE